MTKKKSSSHKKTSYLPARLREGLEEADQLLSTKVPQEALGLLLDLDVKFPHHPDVLGLMAEAYFDLGNHQGYLHAIYKLNRLTPNDPDLKMGLIGAYLATGRFGLALRASRQFLERWPQDERGDDVQEITRKLESSLNELFSEAKNTIENELDFACKHEEMQLLMEMENFQQCKRMADELLIQKPYFLPVMNNLSLIYWVEGNLPAAIETSQQVLNIQPDNIHALSNLTRFCFMLGQKENALAFAQRLKDSNSEATDYWVKKVEALSFIDDNEGVLTLLDLAKELKELDQLNHIVWHWCAVAEYRMGNIPKARSYWKKCLKFAPFFSLASDNLEELKKPMHERVCPQAFSLEAWLPKRVVKDLATRVERAVNQKVNKDFHEILSTFLLDHIEMLHFIPAALSRGNIEARKFALKLAEMTAHPMALAYLKDFALGKEGPDSLRLQAAQIITQHHILPPGQSIEMWIQGGYKPVLVFGFNITSEPILERPLKPGVQRLMEQAIQALHVEDGAKAEYYLRKGLKLQPNDPSMLNNLSLSLRIQGKVVESDALADQITEQFPDYFFGQIISIRRAIQAEKLEKAQTILDKLMRKSQFHITEFSALCACQVELAITQTEYEKALSWYRIWEQSYPDDPVLENFETQIEMLEAIISFKKGFRKKRQPKQSSAM